MRFGLVLEGGSMRGMFTAGVLDVFMENDISFDGAIGVSAGAVFGCNLKSLQIGRTIRYNKRFCSDKRYVSFSNWIRTGNLYDVDFCYNRLVNELDKFDEETYKKNPLEFYVVCTNAKTGEAVYHLCPNGDAVDIQWMRASAAMPVASKVVEIDGMELTDGGIADSIPIKYFENIGYEKNVVVLTQPKGFVKKLNSMTPYIKPFLRKYPNVVKSLYDRHIRYNETIEYITQQEKQGRLLVIRPEVPIAVKAVETNPQSLENAYQLGRKAGLERLDEVRAFLNS